MDASIFLFQRILCPYHLTENVIGILGGNAFSHTLRSVFLYNISLVVIIRLRYPGLPVRIPLFPALCLGLADISIFIVYQKNFFLIRRKPLPILVFFSNCVFLDISSKIVCLICGNHFGTIFPPDGGTCLGQDISLCVRHSFGNVLTQHGIIKLVVIIICIHLRLIYQWIQFLAVTDGNRLCHIILADDFCFFLGKIPRGAVGGIQFPVAEAGTADLFACIVIEIFAAA